MQTQPQSANPAVRNGLIFGAILAAVNILSVIIQWATGSYQSQAQAASGTTTALSATSFLGCLTFLVALALCFIAGMNTTGVTGRVGSGALAGLITGVVGALIGGILGVIVVIAFVVPNLTIPATSTLSSAQIAGIIIGSAIVGIILGLIIDGGIGAGLGALGGLVGRNNYRGPGQTYQEAYYPGGVNQPGYRTSSRLPVSRVPPGAAGVRTATGGATHAASAAGVRSTASAAGVRSGPRHHLRYPPATRRRLSRARNPHHPCRRRYPSPAIPRCLRWCRSHPRRKCLPPSRLRWIPLRHPLHPRPDSQALN